MGRSLNINHVLNADKLTKAQFKKQFTDMMKAKGYTSAKEEDAELCYELVFSADRKWVTILSEDDTEAKNKASAFARDLGMQVLSVELVDSDFAELTLIGLNGAPVDTMFLGEPYFDEVPEPSPLKWQTMLGIDWAKVEEIQQGDHTFAEDALCEFGEIIGCENMLAEYGNEGDNAVRVYFKKAGEKKLTLNAAFKEVFGPELEKLGFVKIKTTHPYYVRAVTDEIINVITIKEERSSDLNAKAFTIYGGIATVYRREIDFDKSISNIAEWVRGVSIFYNNTYKGTPEYDDEYIKTIVKFYYYNEEIKSLLDSMEYSLEVTEEFIIPVFDGITNLKEVIEFNEKYNVPMLFKGFDPEIDLSKWSSENEALLYVKTDDKKLRVSFEDSLSKALKNGRDDLVEIYKKRISFFNDGETHDLVLKELTRRKEHNVDRLKKYGIKI